ncbi:protein kinase family protein [Aliarcobacter butzleri]|uniref:protein kinase family protein n=1 Tax=Aliarcobacter butzleri TaxID=28197 RepID=UPI002B246528|nr:protein kinase family protein [Aliarcobacter butzleri]
MLKDKVIEFIRTKDFRFIQELGNGAFGKTVLLIDEEINHQFVCKKYMPLKYIDKKEFYKNFINEIKLLHLLYHKNIVRIFNYYLYSDYFTGYILMEYIDGNDIFTYLRNHPENLNNIFEQTINGFVYLENNNILHRDIRPTNIMVDKLNNVKIIDFGFGKEINFEEDNKKSITINWWGSVLPDDFKEKTYNHKTEIFFIGKLFEDIINEIDVSFKYKHILKKMIEKDYNNRIDSFIDIQREILENNKVYNLFTEDEKIIYQDFADIFSETISERENNAVIKMNAEEIIKDLKNLNQKTMLEDYVSSNHILQIFIRGNFSFYKKSYSTDRIRNFSHFFERLSKDKQNIVLFNLETRFLDTKSYHDTNEDEIPF